MLRTYVMIVGSMEKLDYATEQIEAYKQANRKFFVIRELEVSEAIKNNDYATAIKVLVESKELDANNTEQLKAQIKSVFWILMIRLCEKQCQNE